MFEFSFYGLDFFSHLLEGDFRPALFFIFFLSFASLMLFSRTYVFIIISIEVCFILLSLLFLLGSPLSNGMIYTFVLLFLAAGETALILYIVFTVHEVFNNIQLMDNKGTHAFY